jgi:hypothetical protein
LALDRLTEQRQKKLAETHVIAPQDYDTAYATMQEAEADVALNKAAVETAPLSQLLPIGQMLLHSWNPLSKLIVATRQAGRYYVFL